MTSVFDDLLECQVYCQRCCYNQLSYQCCKRKITFVEILKYLWYSVMIVQITTIVTCVIIYMYKNHKQDQGLTIQKISLCCFKHAKHPQIREIAYMDQDGVFRDTGANLPLMPQQDDSITIIHESAQQEQKVPQF